MADEEFEIVILTPETAYVNRTQNLNVKVTAATYEEAREALEHTLGELASKRVQQKRELDHAWNAMAQRQEGIAMLCQACKGPMQVNSDKIWACPTCNPDPCNSPP